MYGEFLAMAELTYGRLDEVLRGLGFSLRGSVEKNNVYLHERTGAAVVFPEFPSCDLVQPRHLAAVRGILDAYGITDPTHF
jgi:hypothetical protein